MRLIETLYGKRSKYNIYRDGNVFGGTTFYVYRDGRQVWSCSTLKAAVNWVERD